MTTNPATAKLGGIPDRRAFLKSAAVVAATPLAAPIVHASDKAGVKRPILGSGDYQYECIHDWGMASLPSGAHYGNASHGVTVDSEGLIYITHYGDPGSIFLFDPDGKFVKSMGAFDQLPGKEQGKMHGCGHGIDIRKEGSQEFLYLAPSESVLDFVKMDLQGQVVWRKGRETLNKKCGQYKPGANYRPTNTSFSPDGGYFLGDGYGSNLIHQFDPADQYVRTIGGTGSEDGQFQTPHGQWLDSRDGVPKLVVADRANKRLQWFDMDGRHLKTMGGFLFPADIDIQGDLMVVPDLHCRVTLLDKNNRVITHLGDDPIWRERALAGFKMRGQRDQWLPGKFVHPHDACFDRDGNIFVTEWVDTGRVTKLHKLG
jgi:DNA-binding beta-propeller fold protein YncE